MRGIAATVSRDYFLSRGQPATTLAKSINQKKKFLKSIIKMVGLGDGGPSTKHDIQLKDIVILAPRTSAMSFSITWARRYRAREAQAKRMSQSTLDCPTHF